MKDVKLEIKQKQTLGIGHCASGKAKLDSRLPICPRMSQYRHSRESGNLQTFDITDIMDSGYRQNDALRAFSDRLLRGNDGSGAFLDRLFMHSHAGAWKRKTLPPSVGGLCSTKEVSGEGA